jgi:hypothetical protein
MVEERRKYERFEPQSVDVIVTPPSKQKYIGAVLDASCSGMAIDLVHKDHVPSPGTQIDIHVPGRGGNGKGVYLGSATVKRNWFRSDPLFGDNVGIAVQLDNILSDQGAEGTLLSGTQRQTRLRGQSKLAAQDIDNLAAFRRSTVECQNKLFMLTLTLGVALASVYIGLVYYGLAIDAINDPTFSFWRSMVAALSGSVAISCALMISQKAASIQRTDAFIAVLKEFVVRRIFPREYRGWEVAYRRFQNVLNTRICGECVYEGKCGSATPEEQKRLKAGKLAGSPRLDLYGFGMSSTYFFVLLVSLLAVLVELYEFQMDEPVFMLIGGVVIALILAGAGFVIYALYGVRKGKFSFDSYRRCWLDQLTKCRVQV